MLIVYGIYWVGSTASSEPNESCVVYSGGTFEDKEYQEILDPGRSNAVIGWGSTTRCYRNDQRSYIGGNVEGADTGAVSVTCRGDDVVAVETDDNQGKENPITSQFNIFVDYNAYFTLNTSEAVLPEFDREIGRKTDAHTVEGWAAMLNTYLEPQITKALQNAGGDYSCLELSASPSVRAKYQADVVKLFKRYTAEVVKGDYFCGPGFEGKEGEACSDITLNVGTIGLPEGIRTSIENRIAARQDTATQIEINNRVEQKLLSDADIIALYGPQGALIWKGIESGAITFYVLPDGSTVPAPAPVPAG
jgi:hypothetical protein